MFSPQVSHHPPVSAFYVSNRKDGFCLSGSILAKSKFYGIDTHVSMSLLQRWRLLQVNDKTCPLTADYPLGNSLSAILDGEARLTFLNRGEDYVMNMPYAHCKGQRVLLVQTRATHKQHWLLLTLFCHHRHPVWHHDPGTGWSDYHCLWENRLQCSAGVQTEGTALFCCWNQGYSVCFVSPLFISGSTGRLCFSTFDRQDRDCDFSAEICCVKLKLHCHRFSCSLATAHEPNLFITNRWIQSRTWNYAAHCHYCRESGKIVCLESISIWILNPA